MTQQDIIQTDVVIIGAGPCGIFQIFELGLLDIKAHILDVLAKPGGQCSELYPDKPIYDIPAIPECMAQELIDNLMEQTAPFGATYHLDQQAAKVKRREDGSFELETSKGTLFHTKNIIIAAGVGAFKPRLLKVDDVEPLVNKQIFYHIKDPAEHKDKDIIVLGGGDSALDWTLALAEQSKSLTLIHRSDKFRAAPASISKMQELVQAGKIKFMIGNVTGIQTSDSSTLREVEVATPEKKTIRLPLDHLLVFFGLSPDLGPIESWGVDLEKKQIPVDTQHFQTSIEGIYAIGDVCTYPGKKKLILSGFHEAALAAFSIKERLEPNKKIFLQYTTTSPVMHERLGVSTPKKQ